MAKYAHLLLLITLGLAGCSSQSSTAPLEVNATGTVAGLVWLDRNGTDKLESTDAAVPDVTAQLRQREGGRIDFSAASAADGQVIFSDVPVGDYVVTVDSATVGDSVRIQRVDSAHLTVQAGDTAVFLIALSYPRANLAEARTLPLESRIFVEGRALNAWGAFGDSTLSVRDSTTAMRAVGVAPVNIAAGDSVRLLGTTSIQRGQPVLKDVLATVLQTGTQSPAADTVTTAEAAAANAGDLGADLVYMDSAVIQDTTRNAAGELVLMVDDGSGPVAVVLDANIPFRLSFPMEMVGTILRVTGVLVPSELTGEWVVKPRGQSDVVVGPLSYPTVTIDTARARPLDSRLFIEGLALNAWGAFGDSTLHVRDRTGAIRAARVPPSSVAAGDSIRVLGTTDVLLSQPVLKNVSLSILDTGVGSPPARSLTTAQAATAGSGRYDADLVRVTNAIIQDTSRTSEGDVVYTVDDGSGGVDVVLDARIPFFLNFPPDSTGAPVIIGSVVDVTGLEVPVFPAGRWVVKPRGNADVVVH